LTGLKSICIPASVEWIDGYCFAHPNSEPVFGAVETLTFECGSKLRRIEAFAFVGCHLLQSICLPASAEIIESGICELQIESRNSHFRVRDFFLMDFAEVCILYYFGGDSKIEIHDHTSGGRLLPAPSQSLFHHPSPARPDFSPLHITILEAIIDGGPVGDLVYRSLALLPTFSPRVLGMLEPNLAFLALAQHRPQTERVEADDRIGARYLPPSGRLLPFRSLFDVAFFAVFLAGFGRIILKLGFVISNPATLTFGRRITLTANVPRHAATHSGGFAR
jgi:hypothetical protein